MLWSRYLSMDFFDLYQQGQLKQHARGLRQTAEDISDQRRQTDLQLSNADQRVDRLALICEAMWDLMREHTTLTDEDLANKLAELDMSDGNKDGRRQQISAACVCGAMVNARSEICQFCGADAPQRSMFNAI